MAALSRSPSHILLAETDLTRVVQQGPTGPRTDFLELAISRLGTGFL